MIDWHSHILPGMDDGSRTVETSLSMMEMEIKDGIKTVIATPHFYANDETVESFLQRRRNCLDELKKHLPKDAPEIKLGAEVKYFNGISRMENLKDLRIEGSQLLLLEMPVNRFTEYMIRELIELSNKSGIKLVLAHIERYWSFQSFDVWERLFENGVLAQSNASFFKSFVTRRKAISLLKEGKIHFVGSDCHNLTDRPPEVGKAYDYIAKKLGDYYISQMIEEGYYLLENNNQ